METRRIFDTHALERELAMSECTQYTRLDHMMIRCVKQMASAIWKLHRPPRKTRAVKERAHAVAEIRREAVPRDSSSD